MSKQETGCRYFQNGQTHAELKIGQEYVLYAFQTRVSHAQIPKSGEIVCFVERAQLEAEKRIAKGKLPVGSGSGHCGGCGKMIETYTLHENTPAPKGPSRSGRNSYFSPNY
ncbi:MAG: hypothetical protein M1308_22625 [Actinobacteria bacterium]|nr:hypothetical protein [Actinomycetota bacterium]